jgi:predicted HicB family RNase H-like nuclease
MSNALEQKKRRKVGRPAFPKGRAKNGTLRVRVTPDELRGIQARAKIAKQTVSEWIRSTLGTALQG